MARHIIHKQQIILNIPKREEAHAFQNRVDVLLQQELASSMEDVFDEMFPANEIIRIDSLQLNLGNVSAQNFEQEFKDHFIQELRKNLSVKKDKLGDENSTEVLSTSQSAFNAFIYFLENGYLPWYSATKEMSAWEGDILSSFSGNKNQYFFNWLRDNYKHTPVVLQRLIWQFTDSFLENMMLTIAPVTNEPWRLIYIDISTILNNCTRGHINDRNMVWKCLFHALMNDPVLWNNTSFSGAEDSELIFRTLLLLTEHFDIPAADITAFENISKLLATNIVQNAFQELQLFQVAQQELKNDPEKNKGNRQADNNENIPDEKPDKDAERNNEGRLRPRNKKYTGISKEESLFVKNSGAVILHYFLKPFFAGLGLLADGKFKDENTHQRAVLLFHYLATGSTNAAEFDLTLEKILCGFPLEETLPAAIILKKKEKTESKKLLEAVIDHWTPLKNTSIEGLRNSFFERDGKLTKRENGWLLTIEQKTVDVLLGKLPWGFSTIRLPWMQQILNVDWY
ncbi:contractile injection system tape measure protein [Mucilaginibacter sabulilitoris]|uniref:Contractile injection system tape measure protein n=1 Tax=Mucilaginibacter sabulilitoris TaxID=1173583 RepID=A0ABZ0TFL2_9SPHI|nr:contractile injection system tape measure protein [Mucilaginibacter sabulilitoris]WPU91356.1 contractile injection system tape measure protein [Mucilaginibacter sabulilitoris]